MKVYVVTNPEFGWDCVVDVCTDEKYVKKKYKGEQYVISEKTLNEKVVKTPKKNV